MKEGFYQEMSNSESRKITIGSRGSDLALWQANHVKAQLEAIGAEVRIRVIKTQGDQVQHLSLDKLEGKGFFTKELEEELLAGTIDLAVHSHKDLPTVSPEGLVITAVSGREDPSELILVRKECVDITRKFAFREGAVVGSSSARRKSQLLSFRPDVVIRDIRGNVPTRVQKLREGQYDAILLAYAGVERLQLDLSDLHALKVSPLEIVPAPAQGVLALQIRETDHGLAEFLQQIHSQEAQEEISVERKILNLFDGGCHLPLGVYCRKEEGVFKVWAAKADTWDSIPKRLYTEASGADGLAAGIVSKLGVNALQNKTIFITRDVNTQGFLYKTLAAYGARLEGRSLIDVKRIISESRNDLDQYDWVWFNSRSAVHFFFELQDEIPVSVQFAVYGRGTEAALNAQGYAAAFSGESSDPARVSAAFASLAKGAKVLVPQARESLRSIEKNTSGAVTFTDWVIYETSPVQVSIPEADILVFTSPSNVESFMSAGHTIGTQKIVAIGTSTAAALQALGCTGISVANTPDETGLAECLFSL